MIVSNSNTGISIKSPRHICSRVVVQHWTEFRIFYTKNETVFFLKWHLKLFGAGDKDLDIDLESSNITHLPQKKKFLIFWPTKIVHLLSPPRRLCIIMSSLADSLDFTLASKNACNPFLFCLHSTHVFKTYGQQCHCHWHLLCRTALAIAC